MRSTFAMSGAVAVMLLSGAAYAQDAHTPKPCSSAQQAARGNDSGKSDAQLAARGNDSGKSDAQLAARGNDSGKSDAQLAARGNDSGKSDAQLAARGNNSGNPPDSQTERSQLAAATGCE